LQSVAPLLETTVNELVENLVTKIFEIPNNKSICISRWEYRKFDEITIQELLSLRSVHSERPEFYLITEDPDETFERVVQRLSNSYQSIINNDGCNAENLCLEFQLNKLSAEYQMAQKFSTLLGDIKKKNTKNSILLVEEDYNKLPDKKNDSELRDAMALLRLIELLPKEASTQMRVEFENMARGFLKGGKLRKEDIEAVQKTLKNTELLLYNKMRENDSNFFNANLTAVLRRPGNTYQFEIIGYKEKKEYNQQRNVTEISEFIKSSISGNNSPLKRLTLTLDEKRAFGNIISEFEDKHIDSLSLAIGKNQSMQTAQFGNLYDPLTEIKWPQKSPKHNYQARISNRKGFIDQDTIKLLKISAKSLLQSNNRGRSISGSNEKLNGLRVSVANGYGSELLPVLDFLANFERCNTIIEIYSNKYKDAIPNGKVHIENCRLVTFYLTQDVPGIIYNSYFWEDIIHNELNYLIQRHSAYDTIEQLNKIITSANSISKG